MVQERNDIKITVQSPQLQLTTTLRRSPTMTAVSALDPSSTRSRTPTIFTILGGTTVPDRAAIVKAHCREGSTVELRWEVNDAGGDAGIGVWLHCRTLLGLMSVSKRIGHVPAETAQELQPLTDKSSTVVAHGVVRSVYVPSGRDEAAVSVEIVPEPR